jgi:hypothetical protein
VSIAHGGNLGTFAYPYDVAPDGQKILALTPSSGAVAPLMVIVNWEAGLRKGMHPIC